jgi:hypothetical protein
MQIRDVLPLASPVLVHDQVKAVVERPVAVDVSPERCLEVQVDVPEDRP